MTAREIFVAVSTFQTVLDKLLMTRDFTKKIHSDKGVLRITSKLIEIVQ
jgi:hypothetical protein